MIRPYSFNARTDDGQTIELMVHQDEIDAGTMDNPSAKIPGQKIILTVDGASVNHLDKGKYQIVQTGEILSSNDPNAP